MDVSVIIPVYNTAPYVGACLDSVLSQDHCSIEVICIDDASTDESGAILDEYAAKDPRVRVVHLPENRRQGHGRNVGLSMAQGTYAYFFDSDDYLAEGALARCVELASEFELDGFFFEASVRNEIGGSQPPSPYCMPRTASYPTTPLSGLELFERFMDNGEWRVFLQRQFWRREYLVSNGIHFLDGIDHDDEYFSFTAIALAKRVLYRNEALSTYRIRRGSITTSGSQERGLKSYFAIFCQLARFINEHELREMSAVSNAAHVLTLAMHCKNRLPEELQTRNVFDASEELYMPYNVFLATTLTQRSFQENNAKLFEPLQAYEMASIYGAGKMADALFERLSSIGYPVRRIIVSSMRDNPSVFHGRKVVSLDDYSPLPDEVVVVAMRSEFHAEVSSLLSLRGIPHFLYANEQLAPASADAPNDKAAEPSSPSMHSPELSLGR